MIEFTQGFHSTVTLHTALALSSKIFLRSVALSHSIFSITGFTLSVEPPVAGSTDDPTPMSAADRK